MPDTPEIPDPKKPEAAKPPVPPSAQAPATPKPAVPPTPRPAPPTPRPSVPAPSADHEGVSVPVTPGVQSPYSPPRPKRTSEEIRRDIEAQRIQLGQNVDHLRDKVTEITDWRGQLMKHRKKIVVGAVATGFVVGGLMALRRR